MPGTITHSWNGTVLTITSDSGTSSMDLKGATGDIGPRGVQGPCGVIYGEDGTILSDDLATRGYVDEKLAAAEGLVTDTELDEYKTTLEARLAAIEEQLAAGGGGGSGIPYDGTVVIE